jgi:hypothetical protein
MHRFRLSFAGSQVGNTKGSRPTECLGVGSVFKAHDPAHLYIQLIQPAPVLLVLLASTSTTSSAE